MQNLKNEIAEIFQAKASECDEVTKNIESSIETEQNPGKKHRYFRELQNLQFRKMLFSDIFVYESVKAPEELRKVSLHEMVHAYIAHFFRIPEH